MQQGSAIFSTVTPFSVVHDIFRSCNAHLCHPRALFLNLGNLRIQLPEFSRQYVGEGVVGNWGEINKSIASFPVYPMTEVGEQVPPTNRS